MIIFNAQQVLGSRGTKNGKWTTLTFANRLERRQTLRRNGEHITFLRLVAPNLQWRHARLFAGNGAQLEDGAHAAGVRQLGQRVG